MIKFKFRTSYFLPRGFPICLHRLATLKTDRDMSDTRYGPVRLKEMAAGERPQERL